MTEKTHRTLLLIKTDPERDTRPAEAVRSALGLVAGEIPLSVYLFREARTLLSATADDLEEYPDGEVLKRFLPTLLQMAGKVYYEPDEAAFSPHAGEPLTLEELGRLLPTFDHTIVF